MSRQVITGCIAFMLGLIALLLFGGSAWAAVGPSPGQSSPNTVLGTVTAMGSVKDAASSAAVVRLLVRQDDGNLVTIQLCPDASADKLNGLQIGERVQANGAMNEVNGVPMFESCDVTLLSAPYQPPSQGYTPGYAYPPDNGYAPDYYPDNGYSDYWPVGVYWSPVWNWPWWGWGAGFGFSDFDDFHHFHSFGRFAHNDGVNHHGTWNGMHSASGTWAGHTSGVGAAAVHSGAMTGTTGAVHTSAAFTVHNSSAGVVHNTTALSGVHSSSHTWTMHVSPGTSTPHSGSSTWTGRSASAPAHHFSTSTFHSASSTQTLRSDWHGSGAGSTGGVHSGFSGGHVSGGRH